MWQLSKLSGSRASVKEKLATSEAPAAAKDFIASQVDALPTDCSVVIVDAFSQVITSAAQLSTTINCQVTVKGIRA
jgi:hypothetical protein